MRVAIIGARRVRQGLGPYLARFVAEAGHELVAVYGTREATARQAAEEVEAVSVGAVRATWSEEAVAAAEPEALIIASPRETHGRWLDFALAHGLHALCEKPLVWSSGSPDAENEGALLVNAFHERACLLRVNTQWPWTLPTFRTLHPEAPAVPAQFAMQMPPRVAGLEAVIDSMSHPLSMLAHFAPDRDARLDDLQVQEGGRDATRWRFTFRYAAAARAIEADIVLDATPDAARTTTYALDGFRASRQVDPGTYAMTLADGDRRIPLPDPTPRLVRSFLDTATRGETHPLDPAADPGLRHLIEIVRVARRHIRDQAQ
ncbi:MAG: Gfo/Idh/MocA family oxidoreductase [Planctomycetota bacterium]|nr:Gfo/Idh/MocA family oxidoreductase [Planctomycetota bacterium]